MSKIDIGCDGVQRRQTNSPTWMLDAYFPRIRRAYCGNERMIKDDKGRECVKRTEKRRTMANKRHHITADLPMTSHRSADSEPVKWDANAIAVISPLNQKSENRVGFNSRDVPKRGAIRCETNGSIDRKDVRNVKRISFVPRSELSSAF